METQTSIRKPAEGMRSALQSHQTDLVGVVLHDNSIFHGRMHNLGVQKFGIGQSYVAYSEVSLVVRHKDNFCIYANDTNSPQYIKWLRDSSASQK